MNNVYNEVFDCHWRGFNIKQKNVREHFETLFPHFLQNSLWIGSSNPIWRSVATAMEDEMHQKSWHREMEFIGLR